MIKMFLVYIQILSIVFSGYCFSATDRTDDQKYILENLLSNGGGELGLKSWNESGGGTLSSHSALKRSGQRSTKFVFSASSDNFYHTAVIVKSGTNNCLASFYYNTASAAIDVEVYFGSTKVAEYLNLPANATGFRLFEQSFVCSDVSSAYTFKVTGGAASDEIIIDDVYIGINKNIGTVQQARVLGSIQWAATASCEWTKTNTSPADFDALAACDDNTITYTGNAVADASNPGQLPQIRLLNVPSSGHIRLVAESFFDGYKNSSTSSDSKWRFSDGTNTTVTNYNNIGDFTSGNHDLGVGSITGSLDLTSGGDKTYKIQGSGGTGATIYASVYGLKITAYYYPSSSETVVSVGSESASWNGYIGNSASCNFNIIQTTYASDFPNDADCTLTERKNTNFGTVTRGTGSATYQFISNKIGRVRVTGNISVGNYTSGSDLYCRLVDESSVVISEQHIRPMNAGDTYTNIALNGYMDVTATGQSKQVKFQCKSSAGSVDVYAGTVPTTELTLEYITENKPMPVIVNSLYHKGAFQDRHISGAYSCASSSCTIVDAGTGDWSVAYTGGGAEVSTVTFSPACSATTYRCTATAIDASGAAMGANDINAWTSSTATFSVRNMDETWKGNDGVKMAFDCWCK